MIVQTSTLIFGTENLDMLLYKCTLFAFTNFLFEMLKGGGGGAQNPQGGENAPPPLKKTLLAYD